MTSKTPTLAALAVLAAALALASCGEPAQPPADASTTPPPDAAVQPPADAALPPGPDAASAGPDASAPADAAAPGLDAAAPGLDAASPGLDAGPQPPDASAPGLDAGPTCLGVDLSSACKSVGVCATAVPTCEAAGWDCHHPATWEATEAACDGLDNDCNGSTDEPAACASCIAAPTTIDSDNLGFALGLQWAGHLADTAYALANPATDQDTAHLYVIDGAALTSEVTLDPGTATAANSVLGANGVLHLGVVYPSGGAKKVFHQQRDAAGAKTAVDAEVASLPPSMTQNFETRIAVRGTSVAIAYMSAETEASWADQTSGAWLPGGALPVTLSDLAFEITTGDEVAWAWIDTAGSGDKPILFKSTTTAQLQLGTSTFFNGIDLGPPDLKADAAGDLHAIWLDGNKVQYRKRTAGIWGTQEKALGCSPGSAHGASLAMTAAGPMVTATCNSVTAGTYIGVAARSASGTWTSQKPFTTTDLFFDPRVFVDSLGHQQFAFIGVSNGVHVQAATRCYQF